MNGVKGTVTAIAMIIGIAAAGVAAATAGHVRTLATVLSLYGAFVVVVASYPGRRAVFSRTRHV